ncbi:hypothetical protein SAMN05444365_12115 [Micromonospora pattaloongensis]|uniref:Uncharacterized protein n=1 Tax=Micromonospora pattaloongensis TaxID=405436 RepID=A0A1H3TBL8_9ACTN|nr:hypothetical protein SAMN05444365_12115 [Micromonospora pattaloongensis]
MEPNALAWLPGDLIGAASAHRGETETLPSGSLRVRGYADIDPEGFSVGI